MQYYLEPANRKSFYKKALVIENEGISQLKSYETIVAEYNHVTKVMVIFGRYSATTARHINTFLEKFGFQHQSKTQMETIKFHILATDQH